NRDPKFRRHQEHRQHLVYASQAAGINLTKFNSPGLQELLKDNTILYMFTGRHFDRRNRARNSSMTEYVIWTSRFFDPPGTIGSEGFYIVDGFVYIPILVSIHHQPALRSDLFAHNASAAHIILPVHAHF